MNGRRFRIPFFSRDASRSSLDTRDLDDGNRAGSPPERILDGTLLNRVDAYVRRRVRSPDAEDVVQDTLHDAVRAANEGRLPTERNERERLLFVIARNKIVDHHRKRRDKDPDDEELRAEPAVDPPEGALWLWHWAGRNVLPGEETNALEWALRHEEGETYESIAVGTGLSANAMRQRVFNLHQSLRERWTTQTPQERELGFGTTEPRPPLAYGHTVGHSPVAPPRPLRAERPLPVGGPHPVSRAVRQRWLVAVLLVALLTLLALLLAEMAGRRWI